MSSPVEPGWREIPNVAARACVHDWHAYTFTAWRRHVETMSAAELSATSAAIERTLASCVAHGPRADDAAEQTAGKLRIVRNEIAARERASARAP